MRAFKLPTAGSAIIRRARPLDRPAEQLLRTLRFLVLLLAMAASHRLPAGVVRAADGDAWGMRMTGPASARVIESLSDVNVGKPPRLARLDVKPIAQRSRAGVSIELLADPATAALLVPPGNAYGPELDKALDWLHRLRPHSTPPARIVLTLVASEQRMRVQRTHALAGDTTVDLVVALPPVPTAERSVEVGKALGIALHETSHAFTAATNPAGATAPDRADDEYRASLVETCYRIDTMRVGDTLRLAPGAGSGDGEYFVNARSRDAARDVVRDLVRAAGSDRVRWDDNVAMLGLDLACAVRLAQR